MKESLCWEDLENTAADLIEDYASLRDDARATVDEVYRELYSTPEPRAAVLEAIEGVVRRRS